MFAGYWVSSSEFRDREGGEGRKWKVLPSVLSAGRVPRRKQGAQVEDELEMIRVKPTHSSEVNLTSVREGHRSSRNCRDSVDASDRLQPIFLSMSLLTCTTD